MRRYYIEARLEKVLNKLKRKNNTRYQAVIDKIEEIVNSTSINHYKNLKSSMKKLKRVHIDKSFVLIFSYDPETQTLKFYDLDHHDDIYQKLAK